MSGRFRARWGDRLGLGVLAAAVLSTDAWQGLSGGLSLTGAERVLRGDLPYRDFWTLYAPGHFYLLAALLRGLGRHWLVGTFAGVFLCAGAVVLFHRLLVERGCGRMESNLAALLLLGALFATPFHRSLGTYPPFLVCVLAAWGSAGRALERPGRRQAWSAGAWLGLAALFKHDVAAYACLAMLAGLLVAPPAQAGSSSRVRRRVGPLAIGALAVFLPPMTWLAWMGGKDLAWDLLVFPATRFRFARPEFYPPLLPLQLLHPSGPRREWLFAGAEWAHFALPLLVAGVAGAWALRRRPQRPFALAFGLAFALHFAAAHVQINTHVVSMNLYAAALGALALATPLPRRVRGAALLLGVVWLGALLARPVLGPLLQGPTPRVPYRSPPVAGILAWPGDVAQLEHLQALVEARVPVDGAIYVGERRHDILITSDPGWYFLLGRRPATRYHELHPAVADTARVQREMIASLRREQPQLVLLRDAFPDAVLDRFRTRLQRHVPQVGATLLDAYLAREYRELERAGQLQVLVPRDPGPVDSAGSSPAAASQPPGDALPGANAVR